MGFVEASDTEGGGGRDGKGLDDDGLDDDWALAKREDKRAVMMTNWKMDADILESAVVAIVNVVDGKARKTKGEKQKGEANRQTLMSHSVSTLRCAVTAQFQ